MKDEQENEKVAGEVCVEGAGTSCVWWRVECTIVQLESSIHVFYLKEMS